jgi:hypothetical protein
MGCRRECGTSNGDISTVDREGNVMTDRNKGQLPLPPPRPNLNALKFPGRQRDPKPYFEAGQRVVCVDASPNRLASNRKLLIAGKIYVIRAIDLGPGWKFPWWGVHLEGLRHFYLDGSVEWAFHPGRFRPVTERRAAAERSTDITVFRKLAESVLYEKSTATETYLPMPQDDKSSRLTQRKDTSPIRSGTEEEELDGTEQLMKRVGLELTRDNYLNLAYLGNPPEDLGEEVGYLPEWVQKAKKRSPE